MKKQQGFTLVETLLYLGLFGLLMTGIVVSAYSMFELTGRTQSRAMLTSEGNFLLGKVNWAMNGAMSVTIGSSPLSLTITRASSPNTVKFDLSSTNFQLQRDLNTPVVLNNSNVKLQNLSFTKSGIFPAPEKVTVAFDLVTNTPDGKSVTQNFSTVKYLHK